MATKEEKQKFYDALKFTPRTYTIQMWGYGGEIVMGTVDRKHFDYFKHRRLDVSDFAWNYDYANDHNIPEENLPFEPSSWYDCDNLAHCSGVNLDSGTVQVCDENGNTVIECSLEDLDSENIQSECGDETYITQQPPGTVVFIGRSNEKGTFFGGEIELTAPFDPSKLTIHYDEVDGDAYVTTVYYGDDEVENNDYSTNGKSSDFGFYLVKEDNSWETYRNLDDIKYEMTEWYPAKIKPVRDGLYTVEQKDKNLYIYTAVWTGEKWVHPWNKEQEVKVTRWKGIAHDPDAETLPVVEPKKPVVKKKKPVAKVKLDVTASWPF